MIFDKDKQIQALVNLMCRFYVVITIAIEKRVQQK